MSSSKTQKMFDALDEHHLIVTQAEDGSWFFYDSDSENVTPVDGVFYETQEDALRAGYSYVTW